MNPLSIKTKISGEALLIDFSGNMNEFSEPLLTDLHKFSNNSVYMNFADLEQINSSGVRIWAAFIGNFSAKRRVYLQDCPEIMVSQFAMIPQVTKGCDVVSVSGRFHCASCGAKAKRLYDIAQMRAKSEQADEGDTLACAKCGDSMESMEDETFFDYLNGCLQKAA